MSTAQKSARTVWVAGNWKMNHTLAETTAFFRSVREIWTKEKISGPHAKNLRLALFPPTLALTRAMELSSEGPSPHIHIGVQNVNGESKGAFTGEVSIDMVREIGLTLALVGHSERRQHFGETDASAKKRTEKLLEGGFIVVHCIGETKEERESGKTNEVLKRQVSEGLPERALASLPGFTDRLVIAYEPVWAIGTGLTATTEQAEEAHVEVRRLLSERYGADVAAKISILYGGSVTPENFPALLGQPNVDGGLVGGASLKPESFAKLAQAGIAATATS